MKTLGNMLGNLSPQLKLDEQSTSIHDVKPTVVPKKEVKPPEWIESPNPAWNKIGVRQYTCTANSPEEFEVVKALPNSVCFRYKRSKFDENVFEFFCMTQDRSREEINAEFEKAIAENQKKLAERSQIKE